MRTPELLAPAGDDDSLAAALAAGADAVYFGLDSGLNARARAANFPVARLPELCDRIHRAGARAFVTVNTLVFEDELPAVEELLRAIASAGADAVIVQDPAVALIARALAPSLELHASTQMTISSAEGAAFAQQLGVRRVVAPRELSVEELRILARSTPLELEVFIHGALCVSWSGQCLSSEAWGGRSANRGQCAQSCRLPYRLVVDGEARELGEVAYLLSPLDLAGHAAMEALVELGIAGLKIEGRLKGPAYIVSAVEGYRRWRDAVVAAKTGAARPQLERDLGRMEIAYSRGFSPGFLGGADHQSLVEGRFPKHRGALLGEVVEVSAGGASVLVRHVARRPSGGAALHGPELGAPPPGPRPAPIPGAGVGFDTGHPEDEEPGGPLFGVEPTAEGWRLRFGRPGPDLSRVRPGHRVFLSSDPRLTAEAKAAVEQGHSGVSGRLPVELIASGSAGQPLRVRLSAKGQAVEAESEEVLTPARGSGLDVRLVSEKLGAFGGTPFHLEQANLEKLAPGLHLPVSALKSLRRTLVPRLEALVLAAARHQVAPEAVTEQVVAAARALHARRELQAPAEPCLVPLVRTGPQLEAVIAEHFPEVELDWMELVGLEKAVRRAREAGLRVVVATTRIQKPSEAGLDARLAALAPDGVLVRHWGALMHFARREPGRTLVHGDFSLNVTNSVTAHQLLALGCDTLTAAHDLDEAQLHAMLRHVPAARVTVAVHHHIPTFHTEHCVYAHTLSHGRDFRTCGRPCEHHRLALEDREGRRHPVVVDVGCRNTVFNAQAQSAASAVPGLLAAGVRRFRVELVWEDQPASTTVLRSWRALLAGRSSPEALTQAIGAHEQFGVTQGTMQTLSRGPHGS